MKKIIFIFAMCSSIYCYCQTTSQDEYNFIVSNEIPTGYHTQVLTDNKSSGFLLADRSVNFLGIYRDGVKVPIGIQMMYKKTGTLLGKTEYFCIPTLDADDLWNNTFEQLKNEDMPSQMYLTMVEGLMKLASGTYLSK